MKTPGKHPRRPARAGFTLVELLAVIAIVGILAAIIIPAVGSMRVRAKQAHSVNNLRQLGGAALLYASEHKGEYPEGGFPRISWHNQMYPYLEDVDAFADPGNDHEYTSWVKFENGEKLPFDYGYNAHINTVEGCPLRNLPYMKGPESTFSSADRSATPMMYTIAKQNNFVSWCFSLEEDSGNDQAFDPRFDGQGNVLWLDGHVSAHDYAGLMEMVDAAGGSLNFATGKRN